MLALGAAALVGGCDGADAPPAPQPAHVLVVVGEAPSDALVRPSIQLALDRVNAGGGVDGAPLGVVAIDTTGRTPGEIADAVGVAVTDPRARAIIGPDTTAQLSAIAPVVDRAGLPVLAVSSAGISPEWLTRDVPTVVNLGSSALLQMAGLVSQARMSGVERIGLLTSVDTGDTGAFSLFGYVALFLGYAVDDLWVEVYGENRSCLDAVAGQVEAGAERVIVTAADLASVRCIVDGLAPTRGPDGSLPFDAVLTDSGPDPVRILEALGADAAGLRGWALVPSDAVDGGLGAGGGPRRPTLDRIEAASYDAVVVAALGLVASGGAGGDALVDAVGRVLAGDGAPVVLGALGVTDALAQIEQGVFPDLYGASGPLEFDAMSGLQTRAGTLVEWQIVAEGAVARLAIGERIAVDDTVDFVRALIEPPPPESITLPELAAGDAAFQPASPERSKLAALIVSASSGFDNYRHQADALARYQRLIADGVDPDHIVMIGADDLVGHPENGRPGEVINAIGGPDVYAGVAYDYGLEGAATVEIIDQVLRGDAEAPGPALPLDIDTDLYIYLVGHGGFLGLGIGATDVAEGLAGGAEFLTPGRLTAALCDLRRQGAVRRVFIEVESCHAGVFGAADFDGIGSGCDGEPLDGVVAITAATAWENSLGARFDPEVGTWVADQFSAAMLDAVDGFPEASLVELYRAVYLSVWGSHVEAFNASRFTNVFETRAAEFLPPARGVMGAE